MSTPNSRVRLPVKDQRVEDILLWRDPVKSGAALAGVTIAFFVFQFTKINFLSISAYGGALLVAVMFLWHTLGGVIKKPPPPVPTILRNGVTEADVRSYAERATPIINQGLSFANRLAGGKEPALSLAVGFALYVVARLTSMLSLFGLVFTAILGAFSLPKVYEMYKHQIDAGIDTARKQATQVYDNYLHAIISKIPKGSHAKPAESSSTKKAE